jgi:alkylation response protein AidB-like acyl-CoA dehydrogenase
MNDTALLEDAVSNIFRDYYTNEILVAAKRTGWCAELWKTLEETGMHRVSVPEAAGGTGGSVQDAVSVVRLAGKYCAPVPLADTALLAGWALSRIGLMLPEGPLAFAVAENNSSLGVKRESGGWRFSGALRRIPWARFARALVIVTQYADECLVALLDPTQYKISPGANLAGEARDDVVMQSALIGSENARVAPPDVSVESAWQRGALSRAAMMCGALDRILDMSVQYAKQRVQFGRPLGKFQAIQQELARLAGEAAIAGACAMSAAGSLDTEAQEFDIAVAKIRAGEAAQTGSLIAHQVHGAIGVTEEYLLHHSTLRLWSWRSEYGSEAQWSERLGRAAIDGGSAWLWNTLTRH